jgi:hypothetical protein
MESFSGSSFALNKYGYGNFIISHVKISKYLSLSIGRLGTQGFFI